MYTLSLHLGMLKHNVRMYVCLCYHTLIALVIVIFLSDDLTDKSFLHNLQDKTNIYLCNATYICQEIPNFLCKSLGSDPMNMQKSVLS